MTSQNLQGKRVLITHADAFMGPVLCEVFADHGATVVASTDALRGAHAVATAGAGAGHIDVLVANLAITAPTTPATEVTEAEWADTFAALVDPLPRLFRAVLPVMIARRPRAIQPDIRSLPARKPPARSRPCPTLLHGRLRSMAGRIFG